MTSPPDLDRLDPRNLIREAYRIEGITIWDCRSVFLDWALGAEKPADPRDEVAVLLAHYGAEAPDHPMTAVLRAAMDAPPEPARRGGRAARVGPVQ
ncbi:conserved hypothetical protein [Dinoroseobacter shibae DFL 12 = DSM 16493]|jgi:hypothetical protein|uniref:Uncharacterized protein n=1 Tax=Dinoroseobacter shibae (strain DSM 16493 / NCIMB 14021 / DFL 12) TaxID=398580 RepID=A8LMH1_DINSH|nr:MULTISPECIES: hypothetical protein [Dinoroseobacter]ABV93516.1 conserved hypothetical protein [Dinoroseobacter shibae DFL 12 = DSM 16493]MDD9715387.1 hypothetical protein [Dinoroseobacter sp. PD6]URF48427.1 hypothetical protein M8008_09155 [Dinoroseobacter shibae]URF52737.1 hypothetical protein M8007_09155 [Dinoroseobacter shibae]